ncbi:preprotein translocase YidC [Planosporangium sp. 12N6]|uniref:preprotein translocase YidC n=1 Tax=Planosporangium spinosum TaxID=3402278 RepID=UPI003CEFE7E8
MTQEQEPRRHGEPEGADVTPAASGDTVGPPGGKLREALPDSDLITEDQAGMAGGSSGSSGGGSGMQGHPDAVDPD